MSGSFYHILKHSHVGNSAIFSIVAVFLIVLSIRGWVKRKDYSKVDKILSLIFVVTLYLQLFFGILLFILADYQPQNKSEFVEDTVNLFTRRFWSMEHFILMIFALFIAHLGMVFSRKTKDSVAKHKKVLFYYSASLVLVLASLAMIYFF